MSTTPATKISTPNLLLLLMIAALNVSSISPQPMSGQTTLMSTQAEGLSRIDIGGYETKLASGFSAKDIGADCYNMKTGVRTTSLNKIEDGSTLRCTVSYELNGEKVTGEVTLEAQANNTLIATSRDDWGHESSRTYSRNEINWDNLTSVAQTAFAASLSNRPSGNGKSGQGVGGNVAEFQRLMQCEKDASGQALSSEAKAVCEVRRDQIVALISDMVSGESKSEKHETEAKSDLGPFAPVVAGGSMVPDTYLQTMANKARHNSRGFSAPEMQEYELPAAGVSEGADPFTETSSLGDAFMN